MMKALKWCLGRRQANPADRWSLDQRLVSFSKVDHHTIGHAVNGVIVTGISGSGKSSGPGETLSKAYLRAGFGIVLHTVKPSDVETALRWCAETNRSDDVVLFGPGHPARLNFLDYTLNSAGAGNGLTDNVVSCLRNCAEIRDRGPSGGGGGGDNKFFVIAEQQALRAAVDVIVAATGQVSVPSIHRLVTSAPTSIEQFHSERWRSESYCFNALGKASDAAQAAAGGKVNGVFPTDLENAGAFWCSEWLQMADRTRSSVLSSVTGTLDTLNRGYCRELLCGETTFRPELLFEGKILIFTMSTLEYREIGQMVQVVVKYIIQKAIESRDIRRYPRPVIQIIDEFQNLVTSADSDYALTCRSARGGLLLLTQTLPTVYAALGGGDLAKQQTASLFANLMTKVLCANSDPETTEFASKLCGKSRTYMLNASRQQGGGSGMGGGFGGNPMTAGMSEQMDYDLNGSELMKLRTGGWANKGRVDAIVVRAGMPFRSSGRNWMRTTFRQGKG